MPTRTFPSQLTARHLERDQVRVVMDSRHTIVIDHPPSMGGDDAGPSPVLVLLAALAGCKAVTVARHARRKGYPVEEIEVRMPSWDLTHEVAAGPAHALLSLSAVETVIEVKGPLTDAQLHELEEVARACPISETLQRGVAIRQTLVRDAKRPPPGGDS